LADDQSQKEPAEGLYQKSAELPPLKWELVPKMEPVFIFLIELAAPGRCGEFSNHSTIFMFFLRKICVKYFQVNFL
jgi:hypothetical protein